MQLPEFEYADPQSLSEACHLLERGGDEAAAIAGGTDLMMALKNRQKAPNLLVDLRHLHDLKQIKYSQKDGLKIGALVSLRRLARDSLVREHYPILQQAALQVGSPQLQAMGTVGGNLCQDSCCMYFNRSAVAREPLEPCHKLGGCLCHVVNRSQECWATYSGDLAPVFMVLRAKLKITDSKTEKVIPVEELFSGEGSRPQALQPGQLVTEVRLPIPFPNSRGVYLKLRQRETLDYPLIGVAVHVALRSKSALCEHAALALTAVGRSPLVIREAEDLKGAELSGERIDELAEAAYRQAQPMKNLYGLTVRYRRSMVRLYVKSAIEQTLQDTKS